MKLRIDQMEAPITTELEACAFLLEGEPPPCVVASVSKRLWVMAKRMGGLSRDEFIHLVRTESPHENDKA